VSESFLYKVTFQNFESGRFSFGNTFKVGQ